jgi:NADH-quinone oxidoreductase subunit G
MPTFKLDGKEIPFEKGDTIIVAAARAGIEIPHYCWHEGLSVAANCRMCLVEIKSDRPLLLPILRWDDKTQRYEPTTKPKLLPACQTPPAENMEVFLDSEEVRKAQAAVQEFLLTNHPVDCPICDQAGECKLQDYYEKYLGKLKRKRGEITHKPKARRLGPTIIYDAERCINCTRCVRFCDEVVGDHVLDERERGGFTEIVLSPGRQLDHGYTLMTAHICPVGALTPIHNRFQCRAWMLRTAMSICPGCATGCNCFIDFDPRSGRVFRLRPRRNMAINKFWMCDDGMMTYRRIAADRIKRGIVRNGKSEESSPREVVETAAGALGKVEAAKAAVLLSAQHCSEDNLLLAKLASEVLGSEQVYLAALGGWEGDNILRNADNNPNRAGATAAAGKQPGTVEQLLQDVSDGKVSALIALGGDAGQTAEALSALKKLSTVVCLAADKGPLSEVANLVIPVACHAEMDGTFVNAKGVAQRFTRAVPPPEGVKPAWQTIVDLAAAMGKQMAFAGLEDVRKAMPSAAALEGSQA